MDRQPTSQEVIEILTYLRNSIVQMGTRIDMRYAPLFYDIEYTTFVKSLDIAIRTIDTCSEQETGEIYYAGTTR